MDLGGESVGDNLLSASAPLGGHAPQAGCTDTIGDSEQ